MNRRRMVIAATALALALTAAAALADDPTNRGIGPQGGASPQPRGQVQGDPDMGPGPGMHGPGMGPGFHGQGMGKGPLMRGHRMGRGPGMGMRGMAGMRGGMLGPRLAQALDLTEAQRRQIADIHDRTMKQSAQTRADLQIARVDLRRLLRADSPDRAAVESQIDRIAGLGASLAKARVDAHLEVRGLLTPEQLKKARELHGMAPGLGRGGRMGWEPGETGVLDEDDGIDG